VAAVALAAFLFCPSNSGVQERVKKSEFIFCSHDIILSACYTDNGSRSAAQGGGGSGAGDEAAQGGATRRNWRWRRPERVKER